MSLTPVEQLTIRHMSHHNTHHLYALAQSDIELWQQSAKLTGMNIVALLPDFLLLSVPEKGAGQQTILYQDKHTMLLCQSLYQGMAISYLPLIFERFPHLSEVLVLPAIDELSDVSASHGLAAETMDDIVLADDIMPAITSFSASTVAMIAEHQLLLTTLAAAP